jgi:AraC-like DNA-binding protein
VIDFNNIDISIDKVTWVAEERYEDKWIYDTSLPKNRHSYTPCYYNLRFIIRGNHHNKFLAGEEEFIKENALSLYSQKRPYFISTSNDLPFEYYSIYFYTTKEFPDEIFKNGELTVYPNATDRITNLCFKAHEIFMTKPAAWQFELKAIVNELLAIFIKNQYSRSVTKYIPANIRKSCQYIRNNAFKDKINISELAKDADLSIEHFIRLFKQYYDVTPKQYAISLRIDRATELLKVTDKSISEISEICGFSSIFYFNKLFKQTYNMTPSKYRESYR